MKADKLAEILLKNPEFEVSGCSVKKENKILVVRAFDITGVADVDPSDKRLTLDLTERE